MTEWLLLLAAVVLTASTGFFVAAEFLPHTVDRGRAEEAAADGDRPLRTLRRVDDEAGWTTAGGRSVWSRSRTSWSG
jgi:CBS domain containing-hemolysin-like protein